MFATQALSMFFEAVQFVEVEASIFIMALIFYAAFRSQFARPRGRCGGKSASPQASSSAAAATAGKPRRSQNNSVETTSGDIQYFATKLKACARDGSIQAVVELFERACSEVQPSNAVLHNCFLDACIHCGDSPRAIKHFEGMKKLGTVDLVSFNTALKAHRSIGRTDLARELVKEMSSFDLKPNSVTFCELLLAAVSTKSQTLIWQTVTEMREQGMKMNSVTCSIMLKTLTMNSSVREVKSIVGLIDEIDEPIDEVLFSSVIDACVRCQQLEYLSEFMVRHPCNGLKLSALSYSSIIKAYGRAGESSRVWALWREMEQRGVVPDSIVFGCMVEALVSNGQADEAWDLVRKQLANEDRAPCINTVIYSTVLKGYATAQKIGKVFTVYREMRRNGVPCNTITCNLMLDACAKCGTMDHVAGLLSDMKSEEVELDIISYSSILKGYCLAGDLDRAFQVLEDIKKSSNFTPDEIMYNSILDGCAKHRRVKDAFRVLEEMKAANITPSNYSVSILVKLLGHERRLKLAFQITEELTVQGGLRPNVHVYTCLMHACIHNRQLDRAFELHDKVVAEGTCKLDEKFYAVLVRGCLMAKKPLRAMQVVRSAYRLSGASAPSSGSSWAKPAGLDAASLEEVAKALRAGGEEEQAALATLATDLFQQRGLDLANLEVVAAQPKRRTFQSRRN